MHIIANEPSLAFYRIQEHVRKVLPLVVDRRSEVEVLQQELQGKVISSRFGIKAGFNDNFFHSIVLRLGIRSNRSKIH